MGAPAPDITLDELARLIRLLGMLGSDFDGEVLNAARLAVRWLAEHQTDWATLLTPEPEPGVSSVVASPDLDALEQAHDADRAQAYRNGYAAGMAAMGAQLRAQAAAMAAQPAPPGFNSRWAQNFATMAPNSPASPGGNAPHGAQAPAGAGQGPAPAGPVRPSPPPAGAWPAGSWQAVAKALLDRDASGIPGVFRGSREADFVSSLLARGWSSLTQAQENWLRDIAGRCGMSW